MNAEQRARFKRSVNVGPEDACWNWAGPINAQGYPVFSYWEDGRGRTLLAHRHFYKQVKGTIPPGACITHTCCGGKNRACMNPAHLCAVSRKELTRQAIERGSFPPDAPWQKKKGTRGEQRWSAKLTWDRVREIRQRNDVRDAVLAAEYGVSPSTIARIQRGSIWKDAQEGA